MTQYPNFDGIVFCYDFLKKMVFGNRIDKAQVEFLTYIPENASVLIIGGGTGEILDEILKYAKAKEITYLEYSGKMIAAAKKRIKPRLDSSETKFEITFIKGSVEMLNSANKFDVVCTPFVLDVVKPEALLAFMRAIDKHLVPTGYWLFSDFFKPSSYTLVSYYHRFLIRAMFIFFNITTGLKREDLPDFDSYFKKQGYTLLASKNYYAGLIQSKAWQRSVTKSCC